MQTKLSWLAIQKTVRLSLVKYRLRSPHSPLPAVPTFACKYARMGNANGWVMTVNYSAKITYQYNFAYQIGRFYWKSLHKLHYECGIILIKYSDLPKQNYCIIRCSLNIEGACRHFFAFPSGRICKQMWGPRGAVNEEIGVCTAQ